MQSKVVLYQTKTNDQVYKLPTKLSFEFLSPVVIYSNLHSIDVIQYLDSIYESTVNDIISPTHIFCLFVFTIRTAYYKNSLLNKY